MKIGFLGCGNMGGALCRAVRRALPDAALLLSDADEAKRDALAATVSGEARPSEEMLSEADYVFLGLKPQILPTALAELSAPIAASFATFISMAAGVTIASLESMLPGKPIIRIMPNTPVEVGMGMTVFTPSPLVTDTAKADFLAMMAQSGRLDEIPEKLMDAACSVSGCGPAFAYLFVNALAEGGASVGLTFEQALSYAAATVAGAMKMVEETGRHPKALADAVCSPGGSTLAGVGALNEGHFHETAEAAVKAAYRRTKELGKK